MTQPVMGCLGIASKGINCIIHCPGDVDHMLWPPDVAITTWNAAIRWKRTRRRDTRWTLSNVEGE